MRFEANRNTDKKLCPVAMMYKSKANKTADIPITKLNFLVLLLKNKYGTRMTG
jgi:hypothetical protein